MEEFFYWEKSEINLIKKIWFEIDIFGIVGYFLGYNVSGFVLGFKDVIFLFRVYIYRLRYRVESVEIEWFLYCSFCVIREGGLLNRKYLLGVNERIGMLS